MMMVSGGSVRWWWFPEQMNLHERMSLKLVNKSRLKDQTLINFKRKKLCPHPKE